MIAPLGTNTAPKRGGGFAAVFAIAVKAGTIASSSGSASDAPTPRRKVRRGRAILVTNIIWILLLRASIRAPGF
jgi:hypothetical protein